MPIWSTRYSALLRIPVYGRTHWRWHSTRRTTAAELLAKKSGTDDEVDVKLNGFIRSVRRQKHVAFAAVGDGTSLKPVQAVFKPEQVEGLSTGSAVQLTGRWAASVAGKEQTFELKADSVKVLGDNDAENYPIQKKFQTREWLRTIPHLRSRVPSNSLLLRLRSQAIATLTTHFSEKGFIQTHTPIITSSDCEGAGEVFTVDVEAQRGQAKEKSNLVDQGSFFGDKKYLTVSSQLHLEALAQSVGKVWTLSPTFRAEKSRTNRHLSEFYMLEAEVCFVDNLDSVMDVVESMVKAVVAQLESSVIGDELTKAHAGDATTAFDEIKTIDLRQRWEAMGSRPWPRITYNHAIRRLEEAVATGEISFDSGEHIVTLEAEHEKYLAKSVGGPLFVTDYPTDQKPFYMAPSNGDHQANDTITPTVACFDLLMPEVCEVAGGSLREHRYEQLFAKMQQKGLLDEGSSLHWYLDLRKFGSAPHGGFGLGFDRLLAYLAGVSNVRDVVTFPRWVGRCDC